MNILQGIIIGIVQGLTEFLPVSSSAHLVFIQKLLGVESSLAFDTFLHLGSLLAVLIFFRADIYKLLNAWLFSVEDITKHRFKEGFYEDPYKRLAWYVILATIPVGIVGILFESQVDALFAGALYVPGFFLFVTGTILYLSQRIASGEIDMSHMGWAQSLFMGLAQACAIMPGLSRSGTTIAAGLVAGLDKEFAAKFSFILSIPAIFGAFIVQLKDKFVELFLHIHSRAFRRFRIGCGEHYAGNERKRRIQAHAPKRAFLCVERAVILLCRQLNGVMVRVIGLHHHPAGGIGASRTSRNLGNMFM